MAWDYSELSKTAKKAGGPKAYVDMLVEMSKAQGRKEMIPVVIATTVVGSGVTYLVTKAVEKRRINNIEIDEAKKGIIDEINYYDKIHKEQEE